MKYQSLLSAVVLSFVSSYLCLPATTFAERRATSKFPAATCKEFPNSIFKPCVCGHKVPKSIKYRSSMKECSGKAAAILSGNFVNSYSVVLRDNQNRDRWPAAGYNGCSAAETELGLNKCSAFKCQKVIRTETSSVMEGPQQICCFGEPGRGRILAGATRMTIKLRDDPTSGNDPLVRICLNKFSPRAALN